MLYFMSLDCIAVPRCFRRDHSFGKKQTPCGSRSGSWREPYWRENKSCRMESVARAALAIVPATNLIMAEMIKSSFEVIARKSIFNLQAS